jgi:hypothetical protein
VHASDNSSRYTLQLLGDPIDFRLDEDGRLVPDPSKR